jgi:hypothetical protein
MSVSFRQGSIWFSKFVLSASAAPPDHKALLVLPVYTNNTFLRFSSCCVYTLTMIKLPTSTQEIFCSILLVYIEHYMFWSHRIILSCYRFLYIIIKL